MSANTPYDREYGTRWTEMLTEYREGYSTSVNDYHEHEFYEVTLILSGNAKVLLRDRFEESCDNRVVLTRPHTPHYITCRPDRLYSRLYLIFTEQFVSELFAEWSELSAVFGENGRIIALTPEETEEVKSLIEQAEAQNSRLGKRLFVYLLLLKLSEISGGERGEAKQPPYLHEAIAYVEENFSGRIVAEELAARLYIGRTTLMTEFKRHTGRTLNEYVTDCRLKNAISLLRDGATVEYAAEKCGFSDSSGLSRAFKRKYGVSPKRYVRGVN